MADKKRRLRILDLDITRKKVRYGRATLTVEVWASVGLTPVARVLDEYRQGERSDEEVAWAFIRNQVVEHSPTFDWEHADLARLLPRVTAAIHTPDMQARTPSELIPELEELAELDQRRSNKGRTLVNQWADFIGKSDMGTLVGEVKRYQPEFAKLFQNYTLHGRDAEIATLGGGPFTVDPSLWEGMKLTTGSADIAKMLGGSITTVLQGRIDQLDWPTVASRFTEVARVNQFPDAGEAVEITAEAAENTESMDELLEGLQPMFANLEKAIGKTKNSTARLFLVALAVALIVMMIESSCARLGVPLKPEAPPAQVGPKDSVKAAKGSKAQKPRQTGAKAPKAKKQPGKVKKKKK